MTTFKIEVLDELPPTVKYGRGLDADTIKLIEAIRDKTGSVIKVTFPDRKMLLRMYYRMRDAKKKKMVDFKKVHRVAESLYFVKD